MTGQVAALVGEGVVDRVADSSLGGQMDHAPGAGRRHQLRERLMLGDVQADHLEAVPPHQPRDARLLERRIIVGVEHINPDHALTTQQQPLGHVVAHEAGRACDDDRALGHAQPRPMEA